MKYEIVVASCPETLVPEVQKMIDLGYRPLGGPFQTNDGVLAQAVVIE